MLGQTRPNEGALELALELDQTLQGLQEIPERRRRKHDGITPAADIFRDLQEPTALILFKVEKENLPFDRHFFGGDGIRPHSLARILVHHIHRFAY